MLQQQFRHLLLIGGTGMLSGLAGKFNLVCTTISVIGRDEDKLNEFREKYETEACKVNTFSCDYTVEKEFIRIIRRILKNSDPVDLCINWMNEDQDEAAFNMATLLSQSTEKEVNIFDVRSSGLSSITFNINLRKSKIMTLANVNYQEIILGFTMEEDNSRWLTHDEIVEGIYKAVQDPKATTVVGMIEPWSARPV